MRPRGDSMSTRAHAIRFCIPATHPALSGHFPGQPVVPGVVLLDRVAALVEQVYGAAVAGLPQAKFLRPLLPEQDAELIVEDDGKRVHFRILHDAAPVATGTVELAR